MPPLKIFMAGAALFTSALSLFASSGPACDVTAYGARGDGKTLDTAAIQKAIDTCAANGGGTVALPAGCYLTGTLSLRSNITLNLSQGATLLGSPRLEDYPPQPRTYREGIIEIEGKHQAGYPMRHLIYARGVENIAIEGRGTIDGNGDAYFSADKTIALARPTPLIELIDSRAVRIENVTIRNAPGWTVHPKNCDDVIIRGVVILNNLRAINSDGIDIDSSRNVIISDCHIEAGDDCIVLKTTYTGDTTAPVENVVVTNCILVSAATALKLGTESHGDFRHILFSNCVIRDSRTGLALYTKDGGTMEDVRFTGITMTTRPKWGKGFELPIVIETSQREPDSRVGVIRDIIFSDIAIHTRGRIVVRGLPQSPVDDITFKNIALDITGYEKYAKASKSGNNPTAKNTKGPDYNSTPAAFIIVGAKNVLIDGLDATWPTAADAPVRHLIYYGQTEPITLRAIRGTASQSGIETIKTDPAAK